jgi:hypothetical protein
MRLATLALLFALPLAARAADDAASAYRIESTRGPLKLKQGAAGKAHVEIVPRAGAHVSPDAPLSVALSSGEALKLEKAKLLRADTHETQAKGVEFDVPFVAAGPAGTSEVKATVNFFICTETLCERQKRDVTLAVLVE